MGTFIRIMTGIPELKAIDVTNTDETQKALEGFLSSMSYAMGSSVIGICLSVMMNIINTSLSCHAKFTNLVDTFKDPLRFVWNESMLKGEIDDEKNNGYYGKVYFQNQFHQNSKDFASLPKKRDKVA